MQGVSMTTALLYLEVRPPEPEDEIRKPSTRNPFYLVLGTLVLLGGLGALLWYSNVLEGPASAGGTWTIDPATAQAIRHSSTPLELPDEDPAMTVSPSGRYVQVRFNDADQTTMVGRMHAGALTIRQVLACGAHVQNLCGESTTVTLQLRLRRASGEADRLAGRWRTPGCDVCPSHSFRAVRLSETE